MNQTQPAKVNPAFSFVIGGNEAGTLQSSEKAFKLSFVLGTKKDEAIKTLLDIKDAMASAMILKLEDELSINDDTAMYARLFYQAADMQYQELIKG